MYATGTTHVGKNIKIEFADVPDGVLQTRYVDFGCQSIKDAAGRVASIFVEGSDVSERHATEEKLRELNADLEQKVIQRAHMLRSASPTRGPARRPRFW